MKGISVQEAAQRLAESSGVGASRYQRGTQGKGSRWASGAAAGAANYATGVQASIVKGSFAKGVSEAGASSYDFGVQQKGVNNYGQGVQLGQDKYAKKTQKFAGLWNATLSTPRGAKRSPANLQRMTENVKRFEAAAGK